MAGCRVISAVSGAPTIRPGELPVLIDTLRAASTIVVALAHGVRRILPLPAGRRVQEFNSRDVLTIGESGGRQLPDFEAGNSPALLVEILARNPRDTVVMQTSNLTRLLISLECAVICSCLNVRAVASYCTGRDTCIIAAGGVWGQVEDLGIALVLAALINGTVVETEGFDCFVQESAAARNLERIGCGADVEFIAAAGRYDVVPLYDGRDIRNVR